MPAPSPATPPASGWAFLVARGRHRGYGSILVPDFLAADDRAGLLTGVVDGDVDDAGPPLVTSTTAGSGPASRAERIAVARRTHRLTHADLAPGAPGAPGAPEGASPVNDEHSRPLHLQYGFVCRGVELDEIDQADLAEARRQALDAYRRFLDDEAGFAALTSPAFDLRSPTRRAPRTARPVRAVRGAAPRRPVARVRAPARARTRRWDLVIAATLAVLVLLAGRRLLDDRDSTPRPDPAACVEPDGHAAATTTTTGGGDGPDCPAPAADRGR